VYLWASFLLAFPLAFRHLFINRGPLRSPWRFQLTVAHFADAVLKTVGMYFIYSNISAWDRAVNLRKSQSIVYRRTTLAFYLLLGVAWTTTLVAWGMGMATDKLCSWAITYFTLVALTIILVPPACYALIRLRQSALEQYKKRTKSLSLRSPKNLKQSVRRLKLFPVETKQNGEGPVKQQKRTAISPSLQELSPPLQAVASHSVPPDTVVTLSGRVFKNTCADDVTRITLQTMAENGSSLLGFASHNRSERNAEDNTMMDSTRPSSNGTGSPSLGTISTERSKHSKSQKQLSLPLFESKRAKSLRKIQQATLSTSRRILAATIVIFVGGIISVYAGFANGISFAKDCDSKISEDPYLGNDAETNQTFPGRRNYGVVDFMFIIFFTFLVWYSGGPWTSCSCKCGTLSNCEVDKNPDKVRMRSAPAGSSLGEKKSNRRIRPSALHTNSKL